MHHLDLFSGIGGFALAADEVFEGITHTFVEHDPFCQAVLKKHWPQAQIYGDIREFITDAGSKKHRGVSGNEWKKVPALGGCHILTGGFPCQPFSHAGQRKGTQDDRYLWPEMLRCVQLFKPTWVIAENVRGLVTWNDGMVLETVCSDLENEGYEVQPIIIPALAVAAPHRRDRVWIIGYRTDADRDGRNAWISERAGTRKRGRLERRDSWDQDWREIASTTCIRSVDDGLPREVDGIPYSFAKWRRESLKGYGNAIVPQVAMQIMHGMN